MEKNDPWQIETRGIKKLSTNRNYNFVQKASPDKKGLHQKSKTHNQRVRIDLHGLSLEQAFELVTQTIERCLNDKIFELLIITGKGSESNPSVLKSELSRWLDHSILSSKVIKHSYAEPKIGGTGARIVHLKKL